MSEQLERLKSALAGHYAIGEQIGQGGMATVFLADDLKHDRKVAIKLLRPELAEGLGTARFLQEIRLTANLQHPHILPLYDSGEAANALYYVMPYVEGETLGDRLQREGPLPVDEAIRITRQIAAGLDVAHSKGIVHRDIKPANILLSAGDVMVADFGIARAVSMSDEEGLTQTGLAVGTPAYMSPEQSTGERDIDARTDVYALGSILYEMLAGEPPYTGRSVQAIFAKRLSDPVPSVKRIRDSLPSNVDAAVSRALAKAPVDRFASAGDFANALTSPRRSLAPSGVLGRIRSSSVAGLIGAAMVVVVAGLVWFAQPSPNAAPVSSEARVAVFPFTFRGGVDLSDLGEGMVDLLSTKLDGGGSLRSVDARAVFAALGDAEAPDPAEGRALAERLGAGLFVLGAVTEVGGNLKIDGSLYDVSRGTDPIAQASVEGVADAVMGMLDDMAGELLVGQGGSRDTRLTQTAALTTSSLPALKAYLRGMRAYREGNFPEADLALREAVAADSTFALAWYQLSNTADWLLRADVAQEASEQAVRYADRLSERDRQLLEALRTMRLGKAIEAERMYRAIVGRYPDDAQAWYQLGEVLFHFNPRLGRDIRESRGAWLQLQFLDPGDRTVLPHLARLAGIQKDPEAIDSLMQLMGTFAGTGQRVSLEMRVFQAFARDDPEAHERLKDDVRLAAPSDMAEIAWSTTTYLHRPRVTRGLVELLTEPTQSAVSRSVGHVMLADLDLGHGRWTDALANLGRAATAQPTNGLEYRALMTAIPFLPDQSDALRELRSRLEAYDGSSVPPSTATGVWFSVHNGLHEVLRLYLLGLVNARLGDVERSTQLALRLEGRDPPAANGSTVEDLAKGVRATAAWQDGRHEDALAILEDMKLEAWHHFPTASAFYSLGYERFLRARLLQEAGRLGEAMRWYGTFENTTTHDLVYLAPSHLHRGEILETLGNEDAALEHYARFVELWSDADDVFQSLVNDARQRVERLAVTTR